MRVRTEKLPPFVAFVLVLLALVAGTPTRAVADYDKPPPDVHVEVGVENDVTAPGGSGGGGCPSSPTGACTNDLGMSWNAKLGCWATNNLTDSSWYFLLTTVHGEGYLAPGGPGWDAAGGAGKTTGSVYVCHRPDCSSATAPCAVVDTFWSNDGVVSPGEVAERAVAAMDLRAPAIGMTGGDPPDHMQYVALPAWMWAADPGESTTGPVTRSASDGGISVTATGVLDKTVWDMGDGVRVTCSGKNAAGTPFEARFAGQPSPTCGYTYTRTSAGQPGEAFTVTVTAYWTITWSGGGQSGTIPVQVSRSVQKMVGEIQVLVVPNPGGRS